jgi:tRNA threonylcarbamoyladenosine biosynthesis protein TsaE
MTLHDAEATEALGSAIGRSLRAGDIVALFGDLGAGKTTLARGVMRGLGFRGEVGSPTFPIIQAYELPDVRLPVWHVDLYRTESEAELQELALEEVLGDGALVIEWPERLGKSLWPDALRLTLAVGDAGSRSLTAQVPEAWEGRWPPR